MILRLVIAKIVANIKLTGNVRLQGKLMIMWCDGPLVEQSFRDGTSHDFTEPGKYALKDSKIFVFRCDKLINIVIKYLTYTI